RGEQEPPLETLLDRLSPCDIVLVEGYKTGGHPKIEVRRLHAKDRTALPVAANVIAIAADHDVAGAPVPVFDLDAIAAIAEFVEAAAGLVCRRKAAQSALRPSRRWATLRPDRSLGAGFPHCD